MPARSIQARPMVASMLEHQALMLGLTPERSTQAKSTRGRRTMRASTLGKSIRA